MQQINKGASVNNDVSQTSAHGLILTFQQMKPFDSDMSKFTHLTDASASKQPMLNEMTSHHQNTIMQEYMQDANFRFFIEFSAGALGGAVSRTV
jgi:hypothetical protein